jgi:hypothetical protein
VARSRLRVAFGGHEVELASNDAAVIDSLRGSFRHMGGTGSGRAPIVELVSDGERFACRTPDGNVVMRGSARDAIRWARQQVIEAMLPARPDLVWLHGAAAAHHGRAILLPGVRGSGKSTLVTALCRRGWGFISDDTLAYDPATFRVLPFPRVPEVREDPGEEMPEEWIREAPKTAFDVTPHLEQTALPVAAIAFPRAGRDVTVTSVEPCAPSAAVLALAEGCWNFAALGIAAPAALSGLVSSVPTLTIRFRDAEDAADHLAEWTRGALDR